MEAKIIGLRRGASNWLTSRPYTLITDNMVPGFAPGCTTCDAGVVSCTPHGA
jgi:hypothetical protein